MSADTNPINQLAQLVHRLQQQGATAAGLVAAKAEAQRILDAAATPQQQGWQGNEVGSGHFCSVRRVQP